MSKSQQAIDAIVAQGILPLYFNPDENVSLEILRAIHKAGIKAIEYTNRGEAAFNNFKKDGCSAQCRNARFAFRYRHDQNVATSEGLCERWRGFHGEPGLRS